MLRELSEILSELGAEFALIGGLAVGYHARKRATVDVDMLVPRDRLEPLAEVFTSRGYLVVRSPDMVQVYERDADPAEADAIVDLVAWEASPVLLEAARVAMPATVLGQQVRIVPRGALVALKFHAAISPRRALGDRHQDIADLIRVIEKRWTAEDEALALKIASLSYPGAGEELAAIIDDVRHGRTVRI
jgi:hypothetical protein